MIGLKNEIKNMNEKEKEIENPDEIVDIGEKTLEFNDQTQRGVGLKTLTPSQMLSRLPISLAQLKTGIDCEKLKKWNQKTIAFFVPFKKINQNNL